ncbi:hypothetical protein [Paenibacillus polymyxa]|uniref:hypothetical protein n=1 Tax=Paenibacillus polymyxa TaxID=1406 RepID=UPI002AB37167|nr:hypothetical protein [Paenibacillus polymyxa]MDY8024239.1 hypothetical protein [Paenibacillus polymyxa]
MAYGNKVKFHYDVPAYIKKELAEAAKKLGITATELLVRLIDEEFQLGRGRRVCCENSL